MKKYISLFALSFTMLILSAQNSFFIQPGAEVTVTGNTVITLQNMNFINNGTFTAGNGTVNMTGNTVSTIDGTNAINLYNLITGNSAGINLDRNIGVSNQLEMVTGLLNVKNFTVDMGAGGTIITESEAARVTDDAGNTGNATTTRNLSSPLVNVNPGNLGVEFISAPALGNTTITRFGAAFVFNGNSTGLIRRYYNIQPANNTALNATVRFYYLDAELNGVNELTAVLWKSINNGASWTQIIPDTRNTALNFCEKTGVNDFSLWTIGNNNSVLPVILSSFNTTCKNNGANLVWATQFEQNSSVFEIEKSKDGNNWATIGSVNANGVASDYNFTDKEAGLAYYRLKQIDIDGKFTYSKVLSSTCEVKSITLMLYPNPASSFTELRFTSPKEYSTLINVYADNGQLVRSIKAAVQQGINTIRINLNGLSNGTYTMKINADDLNVSKKIIKQ
jgi:Secretion system C-terminal sorting domain